MTETPPRFPTGTPNERFRAAIARRREAGAGATMTQEQFMAHAKAVDRIGLWSAWVCYIGNVIALGGCMATAVCWFKGYDGDLALRYNLTGFGLWFIMVSIDQLLLRRSRQHFELLRNAILRPRNPTMRRL